MANPWNDDLKVLYDSCLEARKDEGTGDYVIAKTAIILVDPTWQNVHRFYAAGRKVEISQDQ